MSSGKSGIYAASGYDHIPVNWAALDPQPHIIIVSDTRLYREGLALSLARVDRVVVVGVADTVASALACIRRPRPPCRPRKMRQPLLASVPWLSRVVALARRASQNREERRLDSSPRCVRRPELPGMSRVMGLKRI